VTIVSRLASESIWNMNETEDSNKNRNRKMQNDETTPKYVGYDENKLQEMKKTKRKRISKVDAKQTTCLRPLLALVAYTRFLFSICCRTLSWRVFTTCALRLPSKLTISSIGKGIKSIGVKGLNPYTISNGENSVVECTLRLYANSINGKQFSNSLSSFEWQHAEVVLRSYCFIFVLSLFKFLHHYHISKLSSNLFFIYISI